MTTTNGGPTPAAAQDMQPQLTVVAQYIKDFSFENPNAPQSLASRQEQPQINIQINVSATPLSETDFEVVLKLEGKAETGGTVLFRFELEFARRVPHPECAAGKPAPGGDDRMPAAAVPVRARDHRHRGAQRRLPAAAARSGRFRRPLSPEDGAAAAGAGTRRARLNRSAASGR